MLLLLLLLLARSRATMVSMSSAARARASSSVGCTGTSLLASSVLLKLQDTSTDTQQKGSSNMAQHYTCA
jgi:hypothetical protein